MQRPSRIIRDLPFASRNVIHVSPNERVCDAASIMLLHDFSQLPVLENNIPAGILRWPTILKGALDKHEAIATTTVRDWMTTARTIQDDHQIYEAFSEVLQHEYVLIVNSARAVCGIITAYDLSSFANDVLVPYLLIESAEWGLREVVERLKLDSSKTEKVPQGKQDPWIAGLPEIIKILNHSANWQKLQTALSKPVVVQALDNMRRIRNKLMHFAAGSRLEPSERHSLDLLVRFLDQVGLDGPHDRSNPPPSQ